MKIVGLILGLFLSAPSYACVTHVIAYYPLDNGSSDPDCGGSTLGTYNNSASYVSSPSPPSGNSTWAGNFLSAAFGFYPVQPGSFSLTQGYESFAFNASDVTTGYAINTIDVSGVKWLSVEAYLGDLYILSTPLSISTGITSISTNTLYYCIMNWSSSGISIYLSTNSASMGSAVYTESTALPTTGTYVQGIGVDATNAAYFDGYIGQFSIAAGGNTTTWPTEANPTATNTPAYSHTYSPTTSPTFSASPSFTVTPTPWPTITPDATVPVCGASYPSVFTPQTTPVLIPATTAEAGCIVEPSVINGFPDGKWHMAYHGGCFQGVDAIFIASAPHPEGPWTRYGVVPVIGNGYGGVSDLCSYPTQVSSTAWAPYPYRIYYRDDSSSNTDYCQSADGYTYSYVGTAINAGVALTALCGDNPETYGAGFYYWGGNWWASVNVLPVDCPTAQGGGIAYVDWLFMSTDGGNTFKIAQNVPLFQLQVSTYLFVGSRGSTYADPNGMYYMINQDNVPSSLYISRGYDLANWQTSSIPIATPVANLWGMTACNQTADACMVQSGGNVYVFYDGTDNSNETGRIGYMEYPGTLANLDACQNIGPTYTYTPTPTMTPSLTFTVVPTATACVTACTDKDRRRGRH